ncbi:unnamed protein product, partial [Mesorhabditis spiculigera]
MEKTTAKGVTITVSPKQNGGSSNDNSTVITTTESSDYDYIAVTDKYGNVTYEKVPKKQSSTVRPGSGSTVATEESGSTTDAYTDYDYVAVTDEYGNTTYEWIPKTTGTTTVPNTNSSTTVTSTKSTTVASNFSTTVSSTVSATSTVTGNRTTVSTNTAKTTTTAPATCTTAAINTQNAFALLDKDVMAGSSTALICLDGYTFPAGGTSKTFTCSSTGSWSGYDASQLCQNSINQNSTTRCSDPSADIDMTNTLLPKARINGTQPVGTMIVHSCKQQYVFGSIGQPLQIYQCLSTGVWTNNLQGEACVAAGRASAEL